MTDLADPAELAREDRRSALAMCSRSGASHIIGGQEWIRERAGLSTEHVRSTVATFTRSAA